MAWVAVDKNGDERIYSFEPYRLIDYWACEMYPCFPAPIILPKGSIKKLIGRDLTFEDEPIELTEE